MIITGQFNTSGFSYPGLNYNLQSANDMVVIKSDAAGNILWGKSFGSDSPLGQIYPQTVATDSLNNIYILGYYIGKAVFDNVTLTGQASFLLRLNTIDGSVAWAKKIGTYPQVIIAGMDVQKQSGTIFVTGTFYNTFVAGNDTLDSNGGSDMFMASLSPAGNFQSVVSYGGTSSNESGYVIKCMPGGDVVVGIGYSGNGFSIGTTGLTAYGAKDIAYGRFNGNNFLPQWINYFGSDQDDIPVSIITDSNQVAYCLSTFSKTLTINSQQITSAGDKDVILTKIKGNGTVLWNRTFGGPGRDDAASLCMTGNEILAGATVSDSVKINNGLPLFNPVTNMRNSFIIKFDTNGFYKSYIVTNDSAGDQAYMFSHELKTMATDKFQNLFVAGIFLNKISIFSSGTNLSSQNNSVPNAYFMRLCQGKLVSTHSYSSQPLNVSIYPNPFKEKLIFKNLSAKAIKNLELFDTYGRVVYRFNNVANELVIETVDLESGVYFFVVNLEDTRVAYKLVK